MMAFACWNCQQHYCIVITTITRLIGMEKLWCAFEDSHMQLCTSTNILYVKTLNIFPCIFLQFRTGATTQHNSCRGKSYILVAVTGITEACIDVSEIKDKL